MIFLDTLITVRDLSFCYGAGTKTEVRALNRINLQIGKGEFTAIIGRNGSGKTTLAKHFNGLLTPTSGDLLVETLSIREARNIREIRKRVGMVFQNPDNQIVSTVVEEDVAFGPENLGVPPDEIRIRVNRALEALGMYDYRSASPNQLSGGQKQRVAIAGVLAMKPDCIVLDEPTALLDPQGRREVLNSIKALNRDEGITIVYITHFMNEAIEFDRIVVMDEGEIKMDGPPRTVFEQADRIRKFGLDLPVPLQLALRLNRKGYPLQANILSVEELVQSICLLK